MTTSMAENSPDTCIAAVEEQFGILFNRTRTRLRGRAAKIHPSLQPVSFTILNELVRRGPTHTTALADSLLMDKSAVSRQIKAMQSLGLIEREVDESDRRAAFLVASDTAVAQVNAIRVDDQEALYAGLRDWPVADVSALARLLTLVNDFPPPSSQPTT
jgi:DNA-binding MarR family transcriptional regulator